MVMAFGPGMELYLKGKIMPREGIEAQRETITNV
jgi:hypothetical protein